ncbi:MAG: preprotein translocase subunit YajC [Clostridia bacterium]|nr:preprotein translocase subunit YajC [Clostridia bacterium]
MLAADAANAAADAGNDLQDVSPYASLVSALTTFIPLVLIVVFFYFFLIRPQKKQEKEKQKMLNSIEIGDTVTTIGGITGIVRQIKDDEIYIIETGADKNRISIRKWAIQSKDTISE